MFNNGIEKFGILDFNHKNGELNALGLRMIDSDLRLTNKYRNLLLEISPILSNRAEYVESEILKENSLIPKLTEKSKSKLIKKKELQTMLDKD